MTTDFPRRLSVMRGDEAMEGAVPHSVVHASDGEEEGRGGGGREEGKGYLSGT